MRAKGDGGVTQRHEHKTCPPPVDGKRPDHRLTYREDKQ